MFHGELTSSCAGSVDHLMILIIVPLSVNLVAKVFLIQIVLLVT